MNRKLTLALSLVVLTAAMLLSVSAARADVLSVTIASPVVGYPGSTVSIIATVTNNSGSTVFLNQDAYSLPGPFTVDDSPFFANAPFFLNNGDSFTAQVLSILIDPSAPFGTYNGSFSILGGATDSSDAIVSTTPFAVQVVPEPASMLLLGTGLLGIKRARNKKKQ